ncbi:MAG: FHA domain-containing protein [Clostridiales Family XIII bacterium]|jgi:hypothetical protein|nr:FHA domain-containing protein [Clostridiales Family XIII bacterium]
MAIVRCNSGHYYDDEKYADCPYCTGRMFDEADDESTVGFIDNELRGDENVASAIENDEPTVGFYESEGSEDDRTVGFVESAIGSDPVVGWLVCLAGGEKGRDYRLHAGRNFIGRSFDMDVAVIDDDAISRENHCSIIYDPLHQGFALVPGNGTATYLKGQALTEAQALSDEDEITIGGSSFIFIAFCKGERNWL